MTNIPGQLSHIPVLLDEVRHYVRQEQSPRRIVDGTLGNGGHSSWLLRDNPQAQLLGIDRDEDALVRAAEQLEFAADRITLLHGEYGNLERMAATAGWDRVDVVLLDIGVSSPQLDDPQRGFSLRYDGPLDMRMNKSATLTASRLLNRADEAELARIFYEYGEIRRSRRLAAAIVARRREKPFATTLDFAEFCDAVLGKARPGRLPTPTLCFQALRIAVNDELGELHRGLAAAHKLLVSGGLLLVISFHSLEDRIVKRFFRREAQECICPPGLPLCVCQHQASLKIVTRRPVTASRDECRRNSRSACAKLRVAVKL